MERIGEIVAARSTGILSTAGVAHTVKATKSRNEKEEVLNEEKYSSLVVR